MEKPKKNTYLFIVACIFAFTTLITILSYIRYVNFFTSNWDLGINIQMLSSESKGFLLYEAADFQGYGVLSHLEIHSTYVAVPISYLYNLIGSPITLFVMQALVVSAGVVPLYFIARRLDLGKNYSVFLILLYLCNFPIISSLMYDYHWISFMPVLFLSLFYFVWTDRYLYAAITIALGSCINEVFPLLALGIALYFFIDRKGLSSMLHPRNLFKRTYLALYALVSMSIIVFLIGRYLQLDFLPSYLNNNAGILNLEKYGLPALFPSHLVLGLETLPLSYWFILLASMCFIPILRPKLLILSLPWLYETFFLSPSYANLSEQYNFIAVSSLIIGVAFGLKWIEQGNLTNRGKYVVLAAPAVSVLVISANSFSAVRTNFSSIISIFIVLVAAVIIAFLLSRLRKNGMLRKKLSRLESRHFIAALSVLILVFSFLAGPLNVNNDNRNIDSGYAFAYTLNPEFRSAEAVAELIPTNASVAASDNLFPLVATDPYALAFYWLPLDDLGRGGYYNFSNPEHFQYIFVDQSQCIDLPVSVTQAIDNSSIYGVYAKIITGLSYPGNITLYELNFTGTTRIYDAPSSQG
ncbi:MAG: DUF2079 domain-containing protein [Thermoplasmataceae archaeon]